MADINNGSSWRKWDLHIHTPLSICQDYGWEDKFEEFITALEWLPADVKVIWINDYYFIDGYEKVMEYKAIWRLKNIDKIFPILEFRIDTFSTASESKFQKINLHILFNINEEDIKNEIKKIKEEFIALIKLSKLHPTKPLSKENFTSESSDNKLKTGFNELIPNTDEIRALIKTDAWKDKTFLFLGYIEWNNLEKWDQLKLQKKDLYDLTDAFFTASETDDLSKKEEVLFWFWNKPLLHSRDIHNFERLSPDKYKCFTWIKSDTTFEWLRQITYEPKERVFIWEHRPSPNIQKISKIELKFKDEIVINRKNDDTWYPFCFSSVKQDLYLSDYFNCFIGWRWSWKSSLLNILYKWVDGWDKDFFENNELKEWDKDFVINDNITIEHSAADIEFLWQNEIEEFATDYEKFSMAIYGRLENQDKLNEKNSALIEKIQLLDGLILIVKEKRELEATKLEAQKTLSAYEKIVAIVRWEEYQAFQSKWIEVQNKLKKLRLSKAAYLKFKEDFSTFLQNFQANSSPDNLYDTAFNDFLRKLQDIEKWIWGVDFSAIIWDETTLQNEYDLLKVQYNNFLTSQGVSAQKLSDISKAQEWINDLSIQIPKIDKQISDLQSKIDTFSFTTIKDEYDSYNLIIGEELKKAQDLLMWIKNDNIWEISLKASFDFERAKSDIFNEDFWFHFKDYKDDAKIHWERLYQILYTTDPKELLEDTKTYLDFMTVISEWNLNGHIFLKNIFKDEANFLIYKLIIAKYFFNLQKYLKINISYNQRPIESSSFWQKCTVVILIMILFGTKPIIIDEPEAHLDSSLIADYLVDLIKQRRKERQIIFATHNANFVINGDAEKIFILEMWSDNKTSIVETTIEDLRYRDKLLKLEWWQVAFELRERKYHF